MNEFRKWVKGKIEWEWDTVKFMKQQNMKGSKWLFRKYKKKAKNKHKKWLKKSGEMDYDT